MKRLNISKKKSKHETTCGRPVFWYGPAKSKPIAHHFGYINFLCELLLAWKPTFWPVRGLPKILRTIFYNHNKINLTTKSKKSSEKNFVHPFVWNVPTLTSFDKQIQWFNIFSHNLWMIRIFFFRLTSQCPFYPTIQQSFKIHFTKLDY